MKISWSNDADLHQKRWGQFAPENWGQFAPAKWGQFTPEYGGQVCRILQLESDMSNLRLSIERATQDYLRLSLLWDDENITVDDALEFIEDDLQHSKLMAALLISKGDLESAELILDECSSGDNDCNVMKIIRNSEEDDQQCPRFNSQQILDLQNIANNALDPGYSKARSLLKSELDEEYDVELRFPINYRATFANVHQTSQPFLKISPNPSFDYVRLIARIPEGTSSARIIVTDPIGVKVVDTDVSNANGLFEIDCSDFRSGLFLCTLYLDGIRAVSEKFTKVN